MALSRNLSGNSEMDKKGRFCEIDVSLLYYFNHMQNPESHSRPLLQIASLLLHLLYGYYTVAPIPY